MGKVVTDPKIIAQLNAMIENDVAPEKAQSKKVTDPELLKRLNSDETDFSTYEMVKNIPSSAYNLGSSMVHAVTNPVDTAKSVGNLALGLSDKVDKKLSSVLPDEYLEYGNKANNWLVDKTGAPDSWRLPESAKNMEWKNEKYADAVGAAIKGRYGSTDKFKKTLMDDPAGVLADLAGVLSLGGSAIKALPKTGNIGNAIQKAGKAIEPVNMAVNTGKTALSKLPKSLPGNLYDRAAKFSTTIDPKIRANMTKTALDYQLMPDAVGVAKLQSHIGNIGKSIDGLIDAADATGTKIPVSSVFKNLKELRKDMGGFKLYGDDSAKKINAIAKKLGEKVKREGRTHVTPSELQKFKQDIYKRTKFDVGQQSGNYDKAQIEQAIARAAKEGVEKASPEVRALNAEQGRLLELAGPLQRSANRVSNRNVIPFGSAVNTAAGGVAGGVPGAVAGSAVSAAGLPAVQAGSALKLHELQRLGILNMLEDSMFGANINIGLLNAGRLDKELRK